ncbi:hypothetical protein B0O99DRAFT_592822 [Bisporella sp. PMI_857]|nr:hypothetical protein B0O99DRAFT_592822 [Bisporella sp. PMI_857]
MDDHYSTLGVPPTASHIEIEKVYRKRFLEFPANESDTMGPISEQQKIQRAWKPLKNPEKRRIYDARYYNDMVRIKRENVARWSAVSVRSKSQPVPAVPATTNRYEMNQRCRASGTDKPDFQTRLFLAERCTREAIAETKPKLVERNESSTSSWNTLSLADQSQRIEEQLLILEIHKENVESILDAVQQGLVTLGVADVCAEKQRTVDAANKNIAAKTRRKERWKAKSKHIYYNTTFLEPFRLKDLPPELILKIFEISLMKTGNKKPALLRAIRPDRDLYFMACNIYYRDNMHSFSVFDNSPIERMDATFLAMLRDVTLVIENVDTTNKYAQNITALTNIRHLTILSTSAGHVRIFASRFLLGFKKLKMMKVQAKSNRFFRNYSGIYAYDLGSHQGHRHQYYFTDTLTRILGREPIIQGRGQGTIWTWTAMEDAFMMKAPQVHIKFDS